MHLLQSWFLLWIFLLEVPTGVVADKFGKKTSLFLGAILGSTSLIIFATFPKFELFLLAEFFAAASAALFSGAHEALLYDILANGGIADQSKKIFGRSHSIKMAGAMIAAPIGAFIAAITALNVPMIMDAIVMILALGIISLLPSSIVTNKDLEEDRYLDIARKGIKFLKNHSLLMLITMQTATLGVAGYFVIWLYQPLLKSVGIPLEYYGWFNILLFGAQILIASNFEIAERIFPTLGRYLMFNLIVIITCFLIVIIYPSVISIIAFMIFGGGFALTQGKYVTAHVNEWIPTTQRATVISFMNMLQKTLVIVMNPFIGFFVDHSLKIALLFVVVFVIILFITYSIFGFKRKQLS